LVLEVKYLLWMRDNFWSLQRSYVAWKYY